MSACRKGVCIVSSIVVTSEGLRSQSARVTNGATQVDDTVRILTSEISALAGEWQGAASSSFQDMYQQWQSGAAQCIEAMRSIAVFLDQAATTYETAEEQIRAAAAG